MRPAAPDIRLMTSTADDVVDRFLAKYFRESELFEFAGKLPAPAELAHAEIPAAGPRATVAVVDLERVVTRRKYAALERLRARGYRIVVLGHPPRPQRLGWLMHAGARAFISKNEPLSVLPESVYLAARDVCVLSRWADRRSSSAAAAGFAETLTKHATPREREVLALIHGGLTDEQIAARLGISRGTTFVYVKSLLKKFGATNRVALAVRYEKYRAHAGDAAAHPAPAPGRPDGPAGSPGDTGAPPPPA